MRFIRTIRIILCLSLGVPAACKPASQDPECLEEEGYEGYCLILQARREVNFEKGAVEFCPSATGSEGRQWEACYPKGIDGFSWKTGHSYRLLIETKTYQNDDLPDDVPSTVESTHLVKILEDVKLATDSTYETEIYWDTATLSYKAFVSMLDALGVKEGGFVFGPASVQCRIAATCAQLGSWIETLDAATPGAVKRLKFKFAFPESDDDQLWLETLIAMDANGQVIALP